MLLACFARFFTFIENITSWKLLELTRERDECDELPKIGTNRGGVFRAREDVVAVNSEGG